CYSDLPAENIAAFRGEAQHPVGEERVVIAEIDLVAYVLHAEAETGKIIADRGVIAARGLKPVVATVVQQYLANRRRQVGAGLQLNEERRIALDVGDVIRPSGVFPGLTQVLGN